MEWWEIAAAVLVAYLVVTWIVGAVAWRRTVRTIRAEQQFLGYRPKVRHLALLGMVMLTPWVVAQQIARDVRDVWREARS